MRYARLGVMLALSATPAFAQPAPEGPAEAPPAEPSEPPTTEAAPRQEPSPTPEVAKDIVKDPPRKEPVSWGAESPALHPDRGFRFGSYGRVLAGSDLRGGKPERVKITAVAPRIVEPSYLELEFSYGFDKLRAGRSEIVLRPIVTLAFDDTLFHETGEFDAQPALRNMFLDGKISRDLSMWVGSRMYRGDDIYLFDYWPLDDINTVGGGVQYRPAVSFREGPPDHIELAAHVGFNRLLNEFQFQETEVANPVQGATIVEQLNRQRTIASASAAYVAMPNDGGPGGKLKVHVESHSLPSGTRKRMDGTFEDLPADTGFLVGAQLGAFGFSADKRFRRHANLFVRYAKGLAAFDELAPPTSFGDGLDTGRATELTIGASANWDHDYGNLMVGALSRRFIDADESSTDPDDGWEYALDARPLVRLLPDWFVGADVSYQARFPKGLNPITLRAEDPAIFQIAPMLAWSPMGPSGYDRPQIRLVYRAAYLNEGARNLYVPDDPRHDDKVVHFLGLQCEWWFNSSTYR
jgi:hypothetical protein